MKKIEFHRYAWSCPICGKFHRVKDTGNDTRISKCCGVKVKIETTKVWTEKRELQIVSAKEIK